MPIDIEEKYVAKITYMDQDLELYYRPPTQKELVAFRAQGAKRKGRKIVTAVVRQRIAFGTRVLTGIREGDILISGKPLISNPEHPDYQSNWRQILAKKLPAVVEFVGMKAFETSGDDELEFVSEGEADYDTDADGEGDKGDEGPDPDPLQKAA